MVPGSIKGKKGFRQDNKRKPEHRDRRIADAKILEKTLGNAPCPEGNSTILPPWATSLNGFGLILCF
jgi:hypothetical protein